jgi:hypothetical protein
MIKFRKSWLICGTICTVIVLALVVGLAAYGAPAVLSHGSNPVPPDDGSSGNIFLAHGSNPVPPDDGSSGNILLAHGSNPVPPDDGSSGNIA